METTATSKGQIVIPASIRRRLGIKAGTRIKIEEHGDEIILKPNNARIRSQPARKVSRERLDEGAVGRKETRARALMRKKPKAIVLDSWALIAYLEDESAGERVADIIADAHEEGSRC